MKIEESNVVSNLSLLGRKKSFKNLELKGKCAEVGMNPPFEQRRKDLK